MSNVDWSLIDRLDARFNQLVGIATEEQLKRLLENFHVVQAIANGRLTSCLEQFVPSERDVGCPDVPWEGIFERPRHYVVEKVSHPDWEGLAQAAGIIEVAPDFRELFGRLQDDSPRYLRMQLFRIKVDLDWPQFSRFMESRGLKPARITHLLSFATQYADSVPDGLAALGTSFIRRYDGPTVVQVPVIVPSDDGRRLSAAAVGDFEGQIIGPSVTAVEHILMVRYPFVRREPAAT
ncbi:hypothetical protein AMJ57_00680 [Parcubacteria bacterium SG8_24]|nr:MAG: hypothetical protein AMJ57_00680 [Parcubacteria bacterium SG8_24]